ncbi:MAG TPA: porin family protein [Bryobacteraceae bacterium]|nr:porin family protein [Bryobacteraceae bacterium]
MKLPLLLLSGLGLALQAQPIQLGVKGGVVLTDQAIGTTDESKPYTVGPSIEFQLPHNLAIETGFLYKRIGSSYRNVLLGSGAGTANVADTVYSGTSRGHSFEIPVIGKYYVHRSGPVAPYFGLGFAMRRSWQNIESVVTGPASPNVAPGTYHYDRWSSWNVGAVGAAGVRIGAGRFKVSPEFRYTRWSSETTSIFRNRNQVEFLVGLSF